MDFNLKDFIAEITEEVRGLNLALQKDIEKFQSILFSKLQKIMGIDLIPRP